MVIKMRKFLSVLLMAAMLIGMISIPATAAESKVLRATESEQIGLLQKLEIIDSAPKSEEMDDELTRAEFIMYLANIVVRGKSEKAKRYFTDVPMDHWAADSINELFEMDIISKDETKNFRPKDKITVGEATKLVVTLLGYGKYAETLGEFPYSYMKIADYLGINVSDANKKLTKREAMKLIYETIQAPFCDEKSKDGDWLTILSYYYDIYSYTGLLTEASGISMYGDANENEKTVVIDGDNYLSDIDISDKLGRIISFFYKQVNDDVTPEIFYLVSGKYESKVFEISTDDFVEFSDGKIWYTNGNAKRRIEVPSGAEVIKNGTMESRNIVNAFDVKKGKIRCVDTDNNGDYDFFFIWDYDNIVVSRISKNDLLIYDELVPDKKVELDPDDRIIYICDTAGNRLTFDDLQKGDVVSVYESKNYVKAVVCRNQNTGIIFGMEHDDYDHYIVLGKNEQDKNQYKIDKEYYEACLDINKNVNAYKPEMGSSVTYWIDAAGRIAYIDFKAVSGSWQFGYLIGTYHHGWDDDSIGFRLYDDGGLVRNYPLSDRVTIDGVKYEHANEVLNAIDKVKKYQKTLTAGEDSVNGQILRFRTNSSGEIKSVDTEYSDDNAEGKLNLHRTYDRASRYYYWNSHNFGGDFVRSGKAKIFVVPNHDELTGADADDFMFVSGSYFGDNNYDIEAFRMDKSMGSEDVLVVYGLSTGSYSKNSAIVEEVYQAIDKNEEVKWCVDAYEFNNGRKITLTSKEESGFECQKYDKDGNLVPAQVEAGDVIRYIYGPNDLTIKILVVYDYSEEKKSATPTYGWLKGAGHTYGEQVSVAHAFVKYTDSEMMSVSFTPLSEADYAPNSTWRASYSAVKSGGIVYIAKDKGGKIKITKGTFDDIIPANADGYENARDYLVFTWLGIFYGGVIYQ